MGPERKAPENFFATSGSCWRACRFNGAGAKGSGKLNEKQQFGILRSASMGPERKAPENSGLWKLVSGKSHASMGPERKAPENGQDEEDNYERHYRFNGAGAKGSGKPLASGGR